jgi:hypothetical protein
MANLPANTDMTGSGVTEGGFKGKLNDLLDFLRDTLGSTGTVAAVRTALGLGAMALKADVSAGDIATGAVTTGKLADAGVTTAKLADLAVTSGKMAAGAVVVGKIAAGAVQTGAVADGAISGVKLADGAVTTIKLGDAQVTTAKLADGAVTAAKLANALPFKTLYESPAQSITSGGALSLTHGLGGEPRSVWFILQCKTAEFGFPVGRRIFVPVSSNGAGASSRGAAVAVDGTTIDLRFSSQSNVFAVPRFDTGADATLTNANWDLYVGASR